MKGARISINQTEVFPVAILPHPAGSSLPLGNMAVFGTKFALDFSVSEGNEEWREFGLDESFFRHLGMRMFWKAKEMNSRQGGETGCAETQEVPLGKIGGSEVLCLL